MRLVATAARLTGAVPSVPARTVTSLAGIYNGTDSDGPYQMGAASSQDGGVTWVADPGNPLIPVGAPASWEDENVKDPYLVWDGTQYVLYYSGNDGTIWQTGRATASAVSGPWTKYGSNPVLVVGGSSAFDEKFAGFPVVLYEPDETPKWKMWYSGVSAGSVITIGYAHSADGISWTKHGQVLTAGGGWDDTAVGPAAVTRFADTYYLFYHGTQASVNPRSQVGLVTFTDPEGTYTRDAGNPVIKSRFNDAGTSQSLTGDTGAGTSTVTVADTSAFNVGEAVVLGDSDSQTEVHEVASVDTGTQVTLVGVTTAAFTTGASAVLRPLAYNAIGARSVHQVTNGWVMYGEGIQPVEDLGVGGQKLREGSLRWTATDLEGPWAYDYTAGLLMPLYPFDGTWQDYSNEHLTVLPR